MKKWLLVLLLSLPFVGQTPLSDMDKARRLVADAPTSKAIASGLWSDPATWDVPPALNGTVLIPSGVSVVQDVDSPRLTWLSLKGELSPKPGAAVTLLVDTIVSDMGSRIWAGTPDAPFTGQWIIRFADTGPIDLTKDPWKFGRGVQFMGAVDLNGREVTPTVDVGPNLAGDQAVQLKKTPKGWNAGDRIVLPSVTWSTSNSILDDDDVTLVDVSLTTATFATSIAHAHADKDREGFDRPLVAANMTRRSISFESENTLDFTRRGHVMVMREDTMTPFNFSNVSFIGLGRTNKNVPLTDPDGLGGGTSNERGRYSLHFHKCKPDRTGMEAKVTACLFIDSPGWGCVNHESYVCMQQCLAWKIYGASFVGEDGNETGCMQQLVSIRNTAPSLGGQQMQPPNNVKTNADWGYQGHGIFTMAGGISISDCKVYGSSNAAYVVMGLQFRGTSAGQNPTNVAQMIFFDAANLTEPFTPATGQRLQPSDVPQHLAKLRYVGCAMGLVTWNLNGNEKTKPTIAYSTVDDVAGESMGAAFSTGYESCITHTNCRCVSILGDCSTGAGYVHSGVSSCKKYVSCSCYGYGLGFMGPTTNDDNVYDGCLAKTFQGLSLTSHSRGAGPTRKIAITNFTWVNPGSSVKPGVSFQPMGSVPKSIVWFSEDIPVSFYRPTTVFDASRVFTAGDPSRQNDVVTVDGQRIYPMEETGSWKFPAGAPSFLVGLTNDQAWAQYGVRVGTKILPPDAALLKDSLAWTSPTPPTLFQQVLVNKQSGMFQQTSQSLGYVCKVKDGGGNFVSSAPVNLMDKSWNLVTMQVGAEKRGVWVQCDSSKSIPSNW